MPKESLGNLLIKVHALDESDTPYDKAHIRVTRRLISHILGLYRDIKALALKHAGFDDACFVTSGLLFTPWQELAGFYGEGWADEFENAQYTFEPSTFTPPPWDFDTGRSDRLIVYTGGIYWRSRPYKHSVQVETSIVAIEDVFDWARQLEIPVDAT